MHYIVHVQDDVQYMYVCTQYTVSQYTPSYMYMIVLSMYKFLASSEPDVEEAVEEELPEVKGEVGFEGQKSFEKVKSCSELCEKKEQAEDEPLK